MARARRPEGVTVSSKWGYVYTADWSVDADPPEVKHHDADTLRRQLAETRERLGEWLALYQIHSATPDSGVLENDEVLGELAALRADGPAIGAPSAAPASAHRSSARWSSASSTPCRRRGTCTSAPPGRRSARSRRGPARATSRRRSPTAGWPGARRRADLQAAAADSGATPDALALAAVLARPWADVVLSGAATADTLRSNLRATEVAWTEELDRRLAPLEEDSDRYWERRGGLAWN